MGNIFKLTRKQIKAVWAHEDAKQLLTITSEVLDAIYHKEIPNTAFEVYSENDARIIHEATSLQGSF